MADAGAAPAPAANNVQQQQDGGGMWGIAQTIGRFALMYYGMQWLKGSYSGKTGTPAGPSIKSADGSSPPIPQAQAGIPKPAQYLPLWGRDLGSLLDLHVYLSPEDEFDSFGDVSKLIWKQQNIVLGDTKDMRWEEMELPLSSEVQRNGSLYAHMYLTRHGQSPNPVAKSYVEEQTLYCNKLLTRYQKRRKVVIKKNLVAGSKDDEKAETEPVPATMEEDDRWVSYWWRNLTISLVAESSAIPSSIPPPIQQHLELAEDGLHYYPIFYTDDFWMLSDQLYPINETVKAVNLTLKWEPKSFWYFQTLTMMDDSFKTQVSMMGQDAREHDQIKSMFAETNPILLAVTFAVSMLHSLFDFLAFKNDISFWRNKKDMEGMSFRTIVLNVITQLIIFLYLLDNDTSWMILISNGIGLLIEAWKINKTVIVQRKDTFPFFDLIDKYPPSKLTRKTRKYDQMAFKYLSYALIPLLSGYTIYSVYYEEHKGWYSFIVGTLVGF
ncbi:cleft lip and palate transmembrane 1, partial [Chytriomyces sp. MP71]